MGLEVFPTDNDLKEWLGQRRANFSTAITSVSSCNSTRSTCPRRTAAENTLATIEEVHD